jgi:hypothetical protein
MTLLAGCTVSSAKPPPHSIADLQACGADTELHNLSGGLATPVSKQETPPKRGRAG